MLNKTGFENTCYVRYAFALIAGIAVVAFSSRAKILRECSTIHSPPALFFVVLFKVEISSRKLIPLFRLGSVHSVSASSDDCSRVFSDELRVNTFPDRFPHSAWTAA